MATRWIMRVVSDRNEWAEIGHSIHDGCVYFRTGDGATNTVSHLSLADAKELAQALDRVIDEIEHPIQEKP